MAKVFSGDPADCTYCVQGIYPHEHDAAYQPRRASARAETHKTAAEVYAAMPRRRGRPYKPENWELLRMCECE